MKIPDISDYEGKTFRFLEDVTQKESNVSFCKGMKFKISKLKSGIVHFKIVSDIKECMPAIEKFAKTVAKLERKDIAVLDKVIAIWKKEPKEFEIDKKHWENDSPKGHIINTGVPIPLNHPDKDGTDPKHDTVWTHNYRHKKGKNNLYSYQEGTNEWYGLACYEFIRLSHVISAESFEELNQTKRKDIFNVYYAKGFLSKQEMSIKKLNSIKFEPA